MCLPLLSSRGQIASDTVLDTRPDLCQIQLQLTSFTNVHKDLKTQIAEQNKHLRMLLPKDPKDDLQDSQPDGNAQVINPPERVVCPSSETVPGSKSSPLPGTEGTKQLDQTRQQGSEPNNGTIRIRAIHYQKNRCVDYCSCRCHQMHALQTPRLLRRFFGSLLLGTTEYHR